ncbi:PEP-CTERM sorting domain-containing protein [Methylomonas sp. HYX-M1]|uniref:PEP-CTERM sorting domain-containing protein n=1 Tax=Methylomonas sp. HYX-M1 TaxID=3139307 RepID=UPI00345C43A4
MLELTRFTQAGVLVAGLSISSVQASVLYENNFESGSTSGLSGVIDVQTAPNNGEKFIGFLSVGASTTLSLNTTGVSRISLSFDLYTLESVDGDNLSFGPDYFDLDINSSETLLHATFSNDVTDTYRQSFGGTDSLAGTGSDPALTGILGYNYSAEALDHTYHLSFEVDVFGPSTNINFVGNTNQPWSDEGFGIDNIRVTNLSAVPVPGSLPLFGSALMGIAGIMRRKRVFQFM